MQPRRPQQNPETPLAPNNTFRPLAHLYKQELSPEEQIFWDEQNQLYQEQEARERQEIAREFAPLPWVREIRSGEAPINPRNYSNHVLDRLPPSHPAYQKPTPSPINPERLRGVCSLMVSAARKIQESLA